MHDSSDTRGDRGDMKTIKGMHGARRDDIGELITYQALPIPSLGIGGLEPFIFLNHHGPQVYPPHNGGLPFGPHPHRGFETVTFILDGDLLHKDSGGYESLIGTGGVQWMTAGSGLIHAEISSDEFKAAGGEVEILQLWVNLPARLKMTEPRYVGLQGGEIPSLALDDGRVTINLISGRWNGAEAPFKPLTDVHLNSVYFKQGGRLNRTVAAGRSVLLYVVRGTLTVNGRRAEARHIVEFGLEGEDIEIEARTDAVVLFGHATPNREPIATHGPFVMNTRAELEQAILDYRAGKFGVWKD
jgi:redox-sensitive bicupin YhaK (pirin superfamily)